MWGNWFSPRITGKCPVDQNAKLAIEEGFHWLAAHHGLNRLIHSQFLLYNRQFFPYRFQCTPEGIQRIMEDLCRHMKLNPDDFVLAFYEARRFDPELTQVPQLYNEHGQMELWLDVDSLHQPQEVLADLTRELGHALNLSADPTMENRDDQEAYSELAAVFFGAGWFLANFGLHPSHEPSDQVNVPTAYRENTVHSLRDFGYALALYSLTRNQPAPDWLNQLRPDVRHAFQETVAYLTQTRDCGFLPAIAHL